ncbi:hypothetical protein [Legionella sainthelensi]|uniref:hypothetical protein n=1 Tax=Legionella sainthelensi TaxID=28087 RepID=UPI00286AAD05|nr:hypothetical protein [Legionella sainthelensi]
MLNLIRCFCIKLYDRFSVLPNLFTALSLSEQQAMISCAALNTKPKKFISSLLSAVPTAGSMVFEEVVNQAVHEKATQLGIRVEAAKQQVEKRIKSYFLSGLEKVLPKNGHMRDYFRAGIFDMTFIERNFPAILSGNNETLQQVIAFALSTRNDALLQLLGECAANHQESFDALLATSRDYLHQ